MEREKILYHEAKQFLEKRIEDLAKLYEGIPLPELKIEKKGKEIAIQFSVDDTIDLYPIVGSFVKTIGPMNLRNNFVGNDVCLYGDKTKIYFHTSFGKRVYFIKEDDTFLTEELDALVNAYVNGNLIGKKASPLQRLRELGVTIYKPHESKEEFGWDYLAGYENVKQEIKDTILLPLQHAEIYEAIAQGTRRVYESIRPKAVLFEGPPGTGKTTMARIIASESDFLMVYVPVESIMTKWYGESERNLAQIFDACSDLGNALIFLDEIDSLATSRDRDLYEATRRVLSVLLRKIDGFEPNDKTILIGATNRKDDLDPALISRFDVSIYFRLPKLEERIAIFKNYAKQLSDDEVQKLAEESEGVSGRNIKDICEHAERRWASKLLREKVFEKSSDVPLPPLDEYLLSINIRKNNGI